MFINSLKFLLRFSTNSNFIFEEVSQTNIFVLGTDTIASTSNSGYLMQNDQYLFGDGSSSNGYNSSITEEYTIGFWWYPVYPGVAVDSNTGNLLTIEMPLISFVDGSSAENPVIEITEHAQTSGNNSLKIAERGGYSAFSEEYTSNQWHHFWVTRNRDELKIFIDGVEQELQDEDGTFSTKVTEELNPFLYVYINHSLDGYSEEIAKNTGIIDEIFLLNVKNDSLFDMQRVINDGLLYVVDDIYTSTNIIKSNIYINDPKTITINSMIDDLSYIFVGRNDGKIMRGSALFWETRRSFSNVEEYDSGGLSGSPTAGFLSLNKDTIRL